MQQLNMFSNGKTSKVKCQCCGHISYEYHRSYNSNMALALLILYRENTNDFVHLENLILSKGYKRCGDFSYLTKYNHIQKMEGKRDDGSAKNGMYKITSAGIMFTENKTKVHSKFIMKDGVFHGFEGDTISITDVLKQKFNYNNLMGYNN